MVDVAEVKIWGQLVGAVRWDAQLQLASFEYAPTFLKKGWDLSPIKMPLSNSQQIYQFPGLRSGKSDEFDTFKGLPGMLADALPDRYGNQLINVWLTQQGRPADSMNPVEQLCFMGRRGMGALQFEPAQLPARQQAFNIEIKSLVEVALKVLSNRTGFQVNLNEDETQALGQILRIGTSAGGARPKAVIAYNPITKEVRSGQVNAPKGLEHWLLKLDGISDAQFGESNGWGRVEYAYYLMARDCGIDIMESELLEENGRAHFMTKRFDREGNATKHHIQTLCGIQHFDYNDVGAYSYEQLFQTMRLLRLTYPEAEQMFRRMVFNILAKNCDDHTKNFSFRLRQGEKWELAPAYDLCYAYRPDSYWVSKQTMSLNGKREDFTREDLLTFAKQINIKKASQVIEQVQATISQWAKFAENAKIGEVRMRAMQKTFPKL